MLFGDNKGKTDQIEMEFGTHLSCDRDLFFWYTRTLDLKHISKP